MKAIFSVINIFVVKVIFLSIFTPALYFVLLNLESSGYSSNINLSKVFVELDPHGCLNSPDNLGCQLNRPIDEKNIAID